MFDKKTYKLLTALYKKEKLSIEGIDAITGEHEDEKQSPYITALLIAKYISVVTEVSNENGVKDYKTVGYKIDIEGKAYVEQRRRDGRNFWVPYAITTFIAVLSLIVALIQSFASGCVCSCGS
mgnify:FL=1